MKKIAPFALAVVLIVALAAPAGAAGPQQTTPTRPHTLWATVQRASAIMAARMAQPQFDGTIYVVEFDGGSYTTLIDDGAPRGYDGAGRRHFFAALYPGQMILATVSAVDQEPIYCRIFAQDGTLVVENGGGWTAQCRLDAQ